MASMQRQPDVYWRPCCRIKSAGKFHGYTGSPTTILLTLNYDNGDNPHTVTLEIPVVFSTDKKQQTRHE